MRKIFIFIIIISISIFFCFYVIAVNGSPDKIEYYPQKIKVKELLKKPVANSEPEFVFPIEITLTGVSKDKKWYRIRVYYDLVFFGKYEFEGWCKVDPWKPFNENATPETLNIR